MLLRFHLLSLFVFDFAPLINPSPWSTLFFLSAGSFPSAHVSSSCCIFEKTFPWPPQPTSTVTAQLLYSIHQVAQVCICHLRFFISQVLFNPLQGDFYADLPLHHNSFCYICRWLLYQLFSIVYRSLLQQFTTSSSLASKIPPFFVVFSPLWHLFIRFLGWHLITATSKCCYPYPWLSGHCTLLPLVISSNISAFFFFKYIHIPMTLKSRSPTQTPLWAQSLYFKLSTWQLHLNVWEAFQVYHVQN